MEDLTGKQFGPYHIVAPLGEGGMAAVYKAYQPAMERHVALKVLPRRFADDPQFTARFHREAKLLAQLQHPHILPVFDYGQADGYTYIVMPFVQSGTLTDVLTGQPLPLPRIRQIISQVGEALNYAHARGLIHRDVKPSNVLLDESGNCLLTDFGLARMVEASVNLTTSGAIVGTPAYMSPEQGSGQKIDVRSDLYSLGVILYEMATGRVPYKAETPIAVIFKHIQDPLPPARSLNPELPEAVERVILKALSKGPEDRYQNAGDMVQALQAAASGTATVPIEAPKRARAGATAPAPTLEHPGAGTARPGLIPLWVWGMVGVTTLGAVIAGGLFLALGRGVGPADQTATQTAAAVAVLSTATLQPDATPASATAQSATTAPIALPGVSSVTPVETATSLTAPPTEIVEPAPLIQTVQRFPAPGEIVTGITWDGEHLWLSDLGSGTIFKVDTSGNLLDAFAVEDSPVSLAWDGATFWMFNSLTVGPPWDVILRFQIEGSQIETLSSFEFSVGSGGGLLRNDLEWDGEGLWYSDVSQFKVYRLDTSGGILTSFAFPKPVTGLAWDGSSLWLAYSEDVFSKSTLAVVDAQGAVSGSFPSPVFGIEGLAWADGYLWAIGHEDFAGETGIYQLDVSRAE